MDWAEHARREDARYRDGEARLPAAEDQDSRQRQLTRMGNAAAGVGLARLMAGDTEGGREWFARAVERYRESYELAPPGSWGRPIAILKARILAGDWDGPESDARWTLEQGAGNAESPIAAEDTLGYSDAVVAVLESFETREDYLEDLPAADTVVVLQVFAARRDMAAELSSPLLPRS